MAGADLKGGLRDGVQRLHLHLHSWGSLQRPQTGVLLARGQLPLLPRGQPGAPWNAAAGKWTAQMQAVGSRGTLGTLQIAGGQL